MNLPENDFMLLSLVNTKLRNGSVSLTELCSEEEWDESEIIFRLGVIGYSYDSAQNSFR